MKHIFKNIRKFAAAHKFLTFVFALVVLGGGYYAYGQTRNTGNSTRYVLAAAQKGLLVASVSGSGQVSTSNQVDIQPKVSADILSVPVKEGEKVAAGTVLVRLDATDALKAVRDAKSALQGSELALQKLQEPADQVSMTQAQNDLIQANQSKVDAQNALAKAYDDGYTATANAFLDLPGVMSNLDTIINGTTVNSGQANINAYYDLISSRSDAEQFHDVAETSYQTALTAYNTNLDDYRATTRYSTTTAIENIISETYTTAKQVSQAQNDLKNFLDLVQNTLTNAASAGTAPPPVLATHETSLQTNMATVNADLSNLLTAETNIQNEKDAMQNAILDIAAKTAALNKLQAGADPLDIQTAELDVTQKQNALQDAESNLADYAITAPFAGTVAKLTAVPGDSASPSAALLTMVTSKQLADISLNEVDAAKVQVGDQATLTFDALPDLTIAGMVSEVDTIGTVTQGVVTYNVTVGFDTEDSRVKPGMSVSAAIVIATKPDAIMVPNAAVKSQGSISYVEEIPDAPADAAAATSPQGVVSKADPVRVQVQTGLANDTATEITSGVNPGDLVIVRTISGSSAAPAAASGLGGARGGGGRGFILGG